LAKAASALRKSTEAFMTKKPKFALFEGRTAHVRALISVGLGWDAYPGGTKGYGPATITKCLEKEGESGLLEFISKKAKLDKNVIQTFVKTLLFKPANTIDLVSGETIEDTFLYIHGPPTSLPKYLEAFTDETELVYDGPAMASCVGLTSNAPHQFLVAEGAIQCSQCHSIICRFCCFTLNNDDTNTCRCVTCHSLMLVGSGVQDGGPRIDKMRSQLVANNILEGRSEGTSLEIEDLYDGYVSGKHNKLYGKESVSFPKEPSEIMDNGELDIIHTFEFQEGGRFLRAENVTDDHRKDLLILLGKFVTYTGAGVKQKDCKGLCENVYKAVPNMLVEFAEGSRFDSGFRLLERSCHHTMDSNNPSLYYANGKICEHNGETCLLINGDIHASMKDQCYDCSCVVSGSGIVTCKCNSKAGSIGGNRHVHVHSMSHLLNLPLLLFDGLAEHMLIELAAEWATRDPDFADADEKVRVVEVIEVLKGAAGLDSDTEPKKKDIATITIADVLVDFSVGTEQAKLAPPAPKESE
jgi:hypothetical protein